MAMDAPFNDEIEPCWDGEADGFPGDSEGDEHEDLDGAHHSGVDLTVKAFAEVTKRFEATPHAFFDDAAGYYKTALTDEGEIAQRVHTLLQKYLTVTDPKDRSVFRPQLISAYWEFVRSVAKKIAGRIPMPKKLLLRFGIIHPNFIKGETREFFAKLVSENNLGEPLYYMDEWLRAVGTGTIIASTTDESRVARGNTKMRLNQQLETASGKLEGVKALLQAKSHQRLDAERSLQHDVSLALESFPMNGFEGISDVYTETQRRAFADIQNTIKELFKFDRELNVMVRDYYQAEADVRTLRDKMEQGGDEDFLDLHAVNTEFEAIRQAIKMTVGRQGNHYPILTKEHFQCGPADVGFRENVLEIMARIEGIDPEAFCRVYKNRTNRIPPFTVLVPSYGHAGICWEPFDKRNRATSRGRIFIPMYPKNLYVAILSAVADLRWQVAKEKASYYWMEEGLTGQYYQWYLSQKLKGDVKGYFIHDYIIWMTKEAEGIQKLEKPIRAIFWRHMPFAQEIKDKLRTRSYTYQELYQRDLNRAMSDGY